MDKTTERLEAAEALIVLGIRGPKAESLARDYAPEIILRQIRYFPYRTRQATSDGLGLLVASIKLDMERPKLCPPEVQ